MSTEAPLTSNSIESDEALCRFRFCASKMLKPTKVLKKQKYSEKWIIEYSAHVEIS